MTLKDLVMFRMKELDIRPKRSLGQNFLISENVVSKIFDEVNSIHSDLIIEVGPGLGVLTEQLIASGSSRVLIELDRKICEFWRQRNETVFEQDALKLNWQQFKHNNSILVLSNLPYQIGSRLVVELSPEPKQIKNMVLMFQKEVAERLVAQPNTGSYGLLSVIVQTYWYVQRIVDVKPSDFYPTPKVDSRVVRLQRIDLEYDLDKTYISFVKRAFQFRRKYMIKSFEKSKKATLAILEEYGYSSKVRAQEISARDFQKIFLMHIQQGVQWA